MKHIAVITEKPKLSGKQSVPDGAICGNGDIGLILGNCPHGMRIYISKCDLWQGIESHDKGGMKPLGYIDIDIPQAMYDRYHVEQDMDRGELRCRFSDGDRVCEIHIRACRAENSIMLESCGNTGISPVLKVFEGNTSGEKGETEKNGIKGIFRSFSGEDHVYETHCFAFMKSVGKSKHYIYVATDHDTENPREYAFSKAESITEEKYDALCSEHYLLWKSFWCKSSVTLDNSELELGWYASQYLLACCTGNEKFPPGLYANFITVENPSWHSDYHMNYNYQAPFYAACSSNHVEFTDCYHAPLEDFFEKGREFASLWGCRGILYPVGVAPKGICSELTPGLKYSFKRLFLGQKSNAVHPADIMVFRWNATKDVNYARDHAYPYIKACLEFFEDWLTFENGRYTVKQDAAHEVPYYRADFTEKKYRRYINDMNNCLTLGLLRMCIPAAIEMAHALSTDEDKCEKWKNILDKLSEFPTYYRNFSKVFRYTEKGQSWNDGNDVGLQHIYPAGCIGTAKTDKELLKIARNTFSQKEPGCWTDDNAVCSFFPMAARLGKDPDVIIRRIHELNEKKRLANMLYDFAGGCLETCPVIANTLNEMMLQSFEGTVRVFPCWDRSMNAEYKTLRADGAFLVSSQMKDGEITYVEIFSEAGSVLEFENPYDCAKAEIDGVTYVIADKIIRLDTQKGSIIRFTRN